MSISFSRFATRTVSIAIVAALPLFAAAQSTGNPPRVPPTSPPPICTTGVGGQCIANPRIDTYDPATCPAVAQSKDGTAIVPSGVLCSPADSAPIAHINCWDFSGGIYDCKGEPLSDPGRLTYGWTVSRELRVISQITNNRTGVAVACVNRLTGPAVGFLTLTVVTDQGKVGTATQALSCN